MSEHILSAKMGKRYHLLSWWLFWIAVIALHNSVATVSSFSSYTPSMMMIRSKRTRRHGLLKGHKAAAISDEDSTLDVEAPVMPAETIAKALWEKKDLFKTNVHGIIRCRCDRGDGEAKFRLAYMPCRNRGEIIRLTLEEAQVPYEVEVVGFERWSQYVKASTPQGKLPVLRNYDTKGNDLGQEGAITRYVAHQCGLAGKDPIERARVDELYCQWFATLRNNGISHDGEHFSVAALKESTLLVDDDNEKKTSKNVIRYKDMFRQNSFSRLERSLTALRYFEDQLEQEGTGFLVGESPTFVDFGLFYILFELAEEDNVPDFWERYQLPELGAFLERIQQRPQILEYLKSPRRMPRYQRDSSGASLYTYVAGKYSPDLSLATSNK